MYTIYNPWSSKLLTCSLNQTPHPETTLFMKILTLLTFKELQIGFFDELVI